MSVVWSLSKVSGLVVLILSFVVHDPGCVKTRGWFDSDDMIPARFAGDEMRRFVEGADRGQSTLFPECLEDWIGEDNPVRVIDVFVDGLDLAGLGFDGIDPEI